MTAVVDSGIVPANAWDDDCEVLRFLVAGDMDIPALVDCWDAHVIAPLLDGGRAAYTDPETGGSP